MTKLTLDLHFHNMKKAKKEIMEFHIKGNEAQHLQELAVISEGVVSISMDELKASAKITHLGVDSKKTAVKFELAGSNSNAGVEFYKKVGMNVKLTVEEAQMSLEDFSHTQHEGIEITQHPDGTIDIVEGQTSIDDIEIEDEMAIAAELDILPFQPTTDEIEDEGDSPE